ncbi:sensor domain-containing diguanylate cyclase [Geomesophilobacter sediminis]|uniref:diguanylate cyclase n=1 Tax=Geomesophilobacter sediminis TaxID=2798584 RepID=A0A8J7JL67_9BACT|nr:HDOD domain-containing protein [Geomesophilobacter sediminis]MBJ6724550.1 HDOD domain-containing protein [Geomesophilobacter sediminis]
MDALNALFDGNPRLPSPSLVAMRILEEVRRDDCTFAEIAEVIGADPALTAKILKVANSPYYSRSSHVTSIDRAVGILGMVLLKNLALSFVIVNDLKGGAERDLRHELFWRRSVTAAVGSELVAELIGEPADDIFVSALLQDIGIFVMYSAHPDRYQSVLDLRRSTGRELREIERERFGFDHQEAGSELLTRWGLPEAMHLPIRHHHTPQAAPAAGRRRAEVLELADRIAAVYHDPRSAEAVREIKRLLAGYRVSETECEQMIDQVAVRSRALLSSFEVAAGELKPFSQILQEANEELARLNLSYEQLVLEYKQARDEAQQLALELKSVNDQLRERAIRDGLTGLFNHRHFQELLDEAFANPQRMREPMTLLLFDIDNFKTVNDSYGHLQGDAVLKAIARTVEEAIRPHGVAARYGGEEFAVLLPQCAPPTEAARCAERLRRSIAELSVRSPGTEIRATVSIGIASCTPARGGADKARLIAAADRALYASKHSGKNRWSFADAV